MISYKIEVPNEKARVQRLVSFLVCLMNVAAFAYAWLNPAAGYSFLPVLGLLVSVAAFLRIAFTGLQSQFPGLKTGYLLFASAAVWLLLGQWLPGISLILFAVLNLKTAGPLVIQFSAAGILYPSFPVKMIPWNEVEDVILKDDILTIELKNNTLMQFSPGAGDGGLPESKAFNQFCALQVENAGDIS